MDSDWLIFTEEELEGRCPDTKAIRYNQKYNVTETVLSFADLDDLDKALTLDLPLEDTGGRRKRSSEDEEPGDDDHDTTSRSLVVDRRKTRVLKVQRGPVSFKISVPAHLADSMASCLSRALSVRGNVSDMKANAVLRIWSLCAFRFGADFTGGLLPNASKILSSAGYKLRTEDGMLFLGPEEERIHGESEITKACESTMEAQVVEGMSDAYLTHSLLDVVRAVLNPTFDWDKIPEKLKKLDDGGTSALSSYIYINGEFRIFCNDKFSDDFITAQECNDRMKQEKAMPVFIWSQ